MARRPKPAPTSEAQGDLFAVAFFPVRRPPDAAGRARTVDSLKIQLAMGQALKECPDSGAIVAARIAEMTGRPLSADALYTYTAGSKPDHDMGISRFVAFVRATGAKWLWDLVVEDDGLVVMEGREAKLATLGLLEQEVERLLQKRKVIRAELGADPVRPADVRRRPNGGRS